MGREVTSHDVRICLVREVSLASSRDGVEPGIAIGHNISKLDLLQLSKTRLQLSGQLGNSFHYTGSPYLFSPAIFPLYRAMQQKGGATKFKITELDLLIEISNHLFQNYS